MIYSAIDAVKGEKAGFTRLCHRVLQEGTIMIVNENELRKVNKDIAAAATSLGGELLTWPEVLNLLNKE